MNEAAATFAILSILGLAGCAAPTSGPADHSVFKLPTPINLALPAYPSDLNDEHITGTATVDFVVDPKGNVIDIKVVEATQRGFAEAAVAAAKKWKFAPGTKDGKPVYFKMEQPISFEPPLPAPPVPTQ